MGSQSDWETMKLASEILNKFSVLHETKSYLLIELQIECILMQNQLKKKILK